MKRTIAALIASAALIAFAAPAYAQNTNEAGAAAGQTQNTGGHKDPSLSNGGPATGTAGAQAGHTYNGGTQMTNKVKSGGPITGVSGASAGMTVNCKSGTRMVKGYKKSNGTMIKPYCRKVS
jgi:hypothetical protein